MQEKKAAMAKQQRRQLADLLNAGKETSARIRVENIIRDDIYTELLEFCELYCELLLARVSFVVDTSRGEVDPGLREAVCSIIYCCHQTELKELVQLGDMLKVRYGREFAQDVMANVNQAFVPEKIVKRCSIDPPPSELVDLYLGEIARAYEVPFSKIEASEASKLSVDEVDGGGVDGGSKESRPVSEVDGQNPVPETPKKDDSNKASGGSSSSAQSDFDALKARFAALKR